MEIWKIIKPNIIYIVTGIAFITAIGLFAPRGIFLPGGLFAVILFNRTYFKGGKSFLLLDIALILMLIITSGVSAILIKGICLVPLSLAACATNELRATGFSIFYFPLAIALVLWMFFRLPQIVKSLFKNRG